MYESKYSKYITKSKTRFAEPEEIMQICTPVSKSEKSEGCGVPLYYRDNILYTDNSDSHCYVQGPTGSKKSRIVNTTCIKSIIKAGESFVANDPKGETFLRTASYAESENYNVLVYNMRDITKSHGWNPLNIIYRFYEQGNMPEAEQAVNDLVDALISPSKENCADIYWPDKAATIVRLSILSLMDSVPSNCFNMANVIQLSREENVPVLRKIHKKMDPHSSAANAMQAALYLSAEKTSSCIYSTLEQILQPFTSNEFLLKLLCRNDIDFEKLAKEKTAVYIIYPDEKTSLSFLVGLFFTQCYQMLIEYASRFKNGRLPRRVNFVIDEFSNLSAIPNFDNRISEARGRNIRYILFGQSYGQLENKYGKNAKTIVSNCDWIVFSSKEIDFLVTLSQICGKKIDSKGNEYPLIDSSDMQHLKKFDDGAEVLILKSGEYPFVTKLPDYEYIDIFGKYPETTVKEVQSSLVPEFITFDDWINGIGIIYNFPFPKEGRMIDLRKKSSGGFGTVVSFDEELFEKELEEDFADFFDDCEEFDDD